MKDIYLYLSYPYFYKKKYKKIYYKPILINHWEYKPFEVKLFIQTFMEDYIKLKWCDMIDTGNFQWVRITNMYVACLESTHNKIFFSK